MTHKHRVEPLFQAYLLELYPSWTITDKDQLWPRGNMGVSLEQEMQILFPRSGLASATSTIVVKVFVNDRCYETYMRPT